MDIIKKRRRNSLKKVLFIALAAVLALSIGLIGCEGEVTPKVLIGATLPETGIFAGFGWQGWGMQAAVDDWNDTYGGITIGGELWEVELIIKDNQSDFGQVGPQSTDLVVTDGVHALLSPDAPADLHDPTSFVANANSVPQIICGGPLEPWYNGARNGTDDKWPYTWLTGFAIGDPTLPNPPPRDVDGYTMIDTWFMFMDEVNALNNTNKIAGVFASSDSDGIGWYNAFPGLMEGYGLTVVGVNETVGLFPMETTDYSSMVTYWKNAGVEILWGNCPGAHFGDLITECDQQSFQPKICCAARAALFPIDVTSWGTSPPLGWGIGTEVWWSPHYEVEDGFEGIGNRTAASLAADFEADTGQALIRSIGSGYTGAQIMLDAISRAGSVDGDDINAALATTDLDTMKGWVNFASDTHFSAVPLSFGQWFYSGGEFTLYIVASALPEIPVEDSPIFPLPAW
jgi:branched-chain amino acid transport system substrate-binding protein